MAYDPKSYLAKALEEGFTSHYADPSGEGDQGQYQGNWNTYGNTQYGDIQVSPLTEYIYEGSGDSERVAGTRISGYRVDSPLSGEYKGWTRSDIFDANNNFLKTEYQQPDTEKWYKPFVNMALMAAPFVGGPLATIANAYSGIKALKSGDILSAAATLLPGIGQIPGVNPETVKTLKTYGDYAKTASALEKAIENKDILSALSAMPGVPGAPQIPKDITDLLKTAGQTRRGYEALKSGDPNAMFREIVGLSKAGVIPNKFADITGEDGIEGFFAPGGEGYVDQNASNLPSWALDPYKDDTTATAFKLPTDEDYEELESILLRYPEQQEPATTPKTSMSPNELNQFLEANIEDPGAIDTLMQDYFPELYRQTISVTAPKTGTPDFTEVPDRTPGTPLDTPSDEDRTVATTPATPGTKPGTPATPGTKPGTPGTPATPKSGMDLAALFALLGAMGGKQGNDVRTPAQSNIARGTPESPYGLMYGMRG